MIGFAARHPTFANLAMLLIIVLGIMALPGLRRETFADFSARSVRVTIAYPGASAEDVEEAVVARVEDAVNGVIGLYELQSESREGLAVITAEMAANGDMTSFLAEVSSKVEAIDGLPELAEDALIEQVGNEQAVVSIAVTGPMSEADLEAYTRVIERELRALDEVSLVEVHGFSDREIQVRLSNQAILQHQLSVDDVVRSIGHQSVDLPVGPLASTDGEFLLRFADQRRTIEEYEQLVILGSAGGSEVLLGEIATIADGFSLEEDKVIFNGQRAGIIRVTKTGSEDSLRILEAVKEHLEGLELRKPPGVSFTLTEDVTSIVEDRLQLLVINGLQGLLLVFLVLWLFLNARLAFWVAASLPVAFLGAFWVMGLIGYSLNLITMMGLLLALGLLMDDGIVLAENVSSHLAKGKGAVQAAIDGVTEVAPGVFSSFATTVCIFLPMAFLEGDIGQVLLVLPVVLIVVMAVSLVEAFLILPNHLGHSLKGREKQAPSAFRRRFDTAFDLLRDKWLGRVVDLAIRWRYATVAAIVALFLVAVGMLAGGVLKFQGFPDIDGDVIQARVLLPQGTPLTKSEEVVDDLTSSLARVGEELSDRQPEGTKLVQNVSAQFGVNSDSGEMGPHLATVTVDLLGAEVRDAPIDELTRRWTQEIGTISDVISVTLAEPGLGPAGRQIEIRIQGRDLDRLHEASLEIRAYLHQFDGVEELADDLRPGKREIRMRMRPGSASSGLDAKSVAEQLQSAFQGKAAREIQVGTEDYDIDVSLRHPDSNTLSDLEYFLVETGDQHVPLGTVASFEQGRGWARIVHIDSLRTVTVTGDVDTSKANAAEVIQIFQTEFFPGFLERNRDLNIQIMGESAESKKTMGSMASGLVLGLLGIFALLSFQFRSYVEPLVVMSAIPLALIGVIFGHLLMDTTLSMPSLLGFVSLGGIVVNDSILLVDFLKRERRKGGTTVDAARHASRARFRAILLTSLTTIAGLTPLLFETSLQAQVLIPMAISIVFGILVSTVLVLIIVPSLYAILDDLNMNAPLTTEDPGARLLATADDSGGVDGSAQR